MLGQRLAIQGKGEERLGCKGAIARQASAVVLFHGVLLGSEFDFFAALVSAEEHNLASVRFETGSLEHRLERYAGPAAVTDEPLQRPAIARALKPGDQLRAAHLLQLVDGQRLRRVDQARNLETVRGHVDFRVAIMLCGEKLILRREGSRQRPRIKEAPVDGGIRVEVRGELRERDDDLALREHRKRPLRNTKHAQPRQGHTAF